MKAFPANPGVPLGAAALLFIWAVLCGCSWRRARESDREILAIYELEEWFTYLNGKIEEILLRIRMLFFYIWVFFPLP